MANTHQHIDLTTLKEVERLLTTKELVSVDAGTAGSTRQAMEAAPDKPLPKRR